MKRSFLFFITFLSVITVLVSCQKSENSEPIKVDNSLSTQLKNLTTDNVNLFFTDSLKVSRGCAGANCTGSYVFWFKNLNNVSEIKLLVGSSEFPLFSYYVSDKEKRSVIGPYTGCYRIRYTLKDGRVFITNQVCPFG